MSILAVNAGSSSLKFALYPIAGQDIASAHVIGNIEGLEPGGQVRLSVSESAQPKATWPVTVGPNQTPFEAALHALQAVLQSRYAHIAIEAVAHRIVHGGTVFTQSVVLTPQVLAQLAQLNPLAPLHQPHNLAGARAFAAHFPDALQVGCFDTAFHAALSPIETTFAIASDLTHAGVRRYGFHGLSYHYVSDVLQQVCPRARGRTILAHLGNGASVCALRNHQSVATSMGFSALDGLMMGTRSGTLDPGVLLYLMEQGWDHARMEALLYKQSGLLGVSGLSADMRTLRRDASASAQFAIELFTHRVSKEIAAQTASIGGVDVVAFTGGIGEHDAVLRAQVGEALSYLGIVVDPQRNAAATGEAVQAIHAHDSAVDVWVVPTDEGRVAARDTLRLLQARQ